VVIENLRAWATRPGIAHGPEIVLGTNSDNALRRDTDLLHPNLFGFVILLEYRDPEFVLGQKLKLPSISKKV